MTVNGHSYEDAEKQTENTNFAPACGKNISPSRLKTATVTARVSQRLSNMLGGGVIVQRFGDLIRGRRSK